MAFPTVGPTRVVYSNTNWSNRWANRYKQARPFNLTLPYEAKDVWSRGSSDVYDSPGPALHSEYGRAKAYYPPNTAEWESHRNAALDKAWAKLRDKISDRAGWAETLVQHQKSVGMATLRLKQVADAFLLISHKEFKRAAKVLRLPKVPGKVSNQKAASANFLEYHLGWQPMVNDIYSSLDLIQQPIKAVSVSARAFSEYRNLYDDYTSSNTSFNHNFVDQMTRVYVKMGAHVAVSNPNLWLANQLGLINPVALAWQVSPLSFVVDWFVNVESFLLGYTDMAGLAIEQPYTTTFTRFSEKRNGNLMVWLNPNHELVGSHQYNDETEGIAIKRVNGLTKPILHIRPPKGLSVVRGLTSVALILSLFGK